MGCRSVPSCTTAWHWFGIRCSPARSRTVTLTVCNTGTSAGNEVVQLYVHDETSTLIRPPQELKAFAKVTLQPGQTQTVSLTLGMRAFAAYDDVRHALFAKAGRFEVSWAH
jgi:beta-glucosidase